MTALIVEDDKMSYLIAELILKDLGIAVRHALSAGEAYSIFENETPDFVLMDLGLPDIDGYEASKSIRSNNSILSHIPIIAISATLNQDIYDKVNDYDLRGPLSKPLDKTSLKALLEELELL